MATTPLDDPHIDLLVSIYVAAGKRIERDLSAMLATEGPRKFLLFEQIMEELDKLKAHTDAWSASAIKGFVNEVDPQIVATLERAGFGPMLGATVPVDVVKNLARSMTGNFDKAIESVRILAQRIFRPVAIEREFPELAFKAKREVAVGLAEAEAVGPVRSRVAELLRTKFKDGIVSIVSKTGRRMFFPLDYYAGMVAHNVKRQARTMTVLQRAGEVGADLVRVTPNPSTIGDWCDAYRGRIYSVSGGSPTYPPLAELPNGGPPFHPWCMHSLSVFISKFYTEDQLEDIPPTDPRFLMKPNDEDSPNRVVRNWWHAKKDDTLPAEITFV